jgi:hypothetical protein
MFDENQENIFDAFPLLKVKQCYENYVMLLIGENISCFGESFVNKKQKLMDFFTSSKIKAIKDIKIEFGNQLPDDIMLIKYLISYFKSAESDIIYYFPVSIENFLFLFFYAKFIKC